MADVLIRNVPGEDLDRIRAAARAQGVSLQSYLRDAMGAQARYLRRQEALARTADRLHGRPGVTDEDREAVLAAIEDAHESRAGDLGGSR